MRKILDFLTGKQRVTIKIGPTDTVASIPAPSAVPPTPLGDARASFVVTHANPLVILAETVLIGAVGGGIAAAVDAIGLAISSGGAIDWSHVWNVARAGAIVAGLAALKRSPKDKAVFQALEGERATTVKTEPPK